MKKLNTIATLILGIVFINASVVFGQNSCDTLRNYIVPANNTYTVWNSAGNGILLGQDVVTSGPDSYQTDVWVEAYNVGTTSTEIRAIRMLPHKVQNNSGSASLTIQVYNDNAGDPGTVIGSQVVNYADLNNEMVWSLVEFNNPVSVTGKFYVGYKVSFATPVDSFALATTQPAANATIFHLNGSGSLNGTWHPVNAVYTDQNSAPINSAFALDVLTSTATVPVPNFTNNNNKACESGSFTGLDATGTTGDVDVYEWWLTDNPPTTIYNSQTGINATLSPTTSSPSNQRIYLWTNGACVSRGVYMTVTVHPDVSATVSTVDETCGNTNGEITINGAGGDGTYLYSIDGGTNTQPNGSFMNLAAGAYNIEVTSNGNGCSYTTTVTLANTPGETISVGSDQTICSGDNATLTASGNGSIEWFDGTTSLGTGASISVAPTADKTYDAVLTDANGCTDTKSVKVTINALPAVSIDSNSIICGYGSTITLVGHPSGGTYSGAGVTGNQFDPNAAGTGTHTITYTYTGTNGCSASATTHIVVDPCLGIEDSDLGNVTIVPNPASDYIQVKVGENNSIEAVKMTSLGGQIIAVDMTTLNNHSTKINVSSVAKGTYFIHLSTAKGETVKKVIVQ